MNTTAQNELEVYISAQNNKTIAWVNEDPSKRWAGLCSAEASHWAQYGVFSVADYELHSAKEILWDLYKTVNGVRPRHLNMDSMTLQDVEEQIARLDRQWEAEAPQREAEAAWEAAWDLEQAEIELWNNAIADDDFSLVRHQFEGFLVEVPQEPIGSIAEVI